MENLKSLESDLDKIISIWLSAKTYHSDNLYLSNPDTDKEKFVAAKDVFIIRARYALGTLAVIQIAKIYNKKEDFAISKFLNRLLEIHDASSWKAQLTIEKIQTWQEELNNNEMISAIKKVKGLRDMFFAHSDRNPSIPFRELRLTQTEIELLLDFCENVLLEIRLKIFGHYSYFVTSETEKADNILNRLAVNVVKKSAI